MGVIDSLCLYAADDRRDEDAGGQDQQVAQQYALYTLLYGRSFEFIVAKVLDKLRLRARIDDHADSLTRVTNDRSSRNELQVCQVCGSGNILHVAVGEVQATLEVIYVGCRLWHKQTEVGLAQCPSKAVLAFLERELTLVVALAI